MGKGYRNLLLALSLALAACGGDRDSDRKEKGNTGAAAVVERRCEVLLEDLSDSQCACLGRTLKDDFEPAELRTVADAFEDARSVPDLVDALADDASDTIGEAITQCQRESREDRKRDDDDGGFSFGGPRDTIARRCRVVLSGATTSNCRCMADRLANSASDAELRRISTAFERATSDDDLMQTLSQADMMEVQAAAKQCSSSGSEVYGQKQSTGTRIATGTPTATSTAVIPY